MKVLVRNIFVVLGGMISTVALALDPIFTAFFTSDAIRGYDTVAYFTEGKAVEGSSEYSFEYKGATWLFSSQKHLDLFKKSPESYEPQYGGYCAYAVSQNQTASIKPELFTIHEGKLYLNYSRNVNEKWLKSKESFITAADTNWPSLLAD